MEFAIVAFPLIIVIFASLQTAVVFFFDQALQSATQKAARQLMTGSAQSAGLTQQQFGDTVYGFLPSQFVRDKLMVDVEASSSFASANTAPLTPAYNPDGTVSPTYGNYNPGNGGDIVIVRVMYDWPILGGAMAFGLANQPDGGHLLVGTAVFKNEPFQ